MEVVQGGGESRGRPVIRLFGSLSIDDGERRLGPADLGGVRPKQVLEILLAARGHRVPVDRLAENFAFLPRMLTCCRRCSTKFG